MNENYRVCDYIAEYLYSIGIRYVFGVTGGGASGINDGFAKFKKIEYISCHHEQSAANAAVGYSKFNYQLSVVNPTTGCGGLNCVTPLCSAYQDHVPVLFISGNVAENQTTKFFREQKGIKLRKLGVQEADIIEVVKPLCKYSVTLDKPENVAYELQKAISIALEAPMGPVWIDIPANVQGALINKDELKQYIKEEKITTFIYATEEDFIYEIGKPRNQIEELKDDLNKYSRCLIIAGNGINLSNTREEFKKFVEKYNIPFVTTFLGVDIIEGNHPLFIGRVGIKGTRSGNFVLQNCNLLLVLGASLNIPITGYMPEKFASQAKKIIIDVNVENHSKNTVKIDKIIKIDLRNFFKYIS